MHEHHREEPARISVAEAKRLRDQGQALFVDVRKDDLFRQSHIGGAISMPLRDIPRQYLRLPHDVTLIFY